MKGRVALLAGTAIGYVLGTRAGRERYEQIKAGAQRIRSNPKVQAKAAQAQDYAKQQAPVVKQKATEAAATAAGAAKDAAQTVKDKTGSGDPAPYPTSASTGLR